MFAIRQVLISTLVFAAVPPAVALRRFRHRAICRRNGEVHPGELHGHLQF